MSNERLFFSLSYSVNVDVLSFLYKKVYINIGFFHFYFLNQDFF